MDGPGGAHPMNLGNTIPARRTPPGDREKGGEDFTAPLVAEPSCRLRFTNGAHRITIRADLYVQGLYRARFGDRMPMVVDVRGGFVTIRYPRVPSCDWLKDQSEHPTQIELNARLPWDIEVRGGVSRLIADLRGLRLGSLSLDGGTSNIDLMLPTPSGNVAVVVLGGASNVAIRRPNGVAVRLRVDGGATYLKVDDRHIGAAGGELDLQSQDYDAATDRYNIAVTGGVNNVSIDEQRKAKARGRRRENGSTL